MCIRDSYFLLDAPDRWYMLGQYLVYRVNCFTQCKDIVAHMETTAVTDQHWHGGMCMVNLQIADT